MDGVNSVGGSSSSNGSQSVNVGGHIFVTDFSNLSIDTLEQIFAEAQNNPYAPNPDSPIIDFKKLMSTTTQKNRETQYQAQLEDLSSTNNITEALGIATAELFALMGSLYKVIEEAAAVYQFNDGNVSYFNNHDSDAVDTYAGTVDQNGTGGTIGGINSAVTGVNNALTAYNLAKANYASSQSVANEAILIVEGGILQNALTIYNVAAVNYNSARNAMQAAADSINTATFQGQTTNQWIASFDSTLQKALGGIGDNIYTSLQDKGSGPTSQLQVLVPEPPPNSYPSLVLSGDVLTGFQLNQPVPGPAPAYVHGPNDVIHPGAGGSHNNVTNTMSTLYDNHNNALNVAVKQVLNQFLINLGVPKKKLKSIRHHIAQVNLFGTGGDPSVPNALAPLTSNVSAGPTAAGGGPSAVDGIGMLNLAVGGGASNNPSGVVTNAVGQSSSLAESKDITEKYGDLIALLAVILPNLGLQAAKRILDFVSGANLQNVGGTTLPSQFSIILADEIKQYADHRRKEQASEEIKGSTNTNTKTNSKSDKLTNLVLNLSSLSLLGSGLNSPYLPGNTFASLPAAQKNGATPENSVLRITDTAHDSAVRARVYKKFIHGKDAEAKKEAYEAVANDPNITNRFEFQTALEEQLQDRGIKAGEAKEFARNVSSNAHVESTLGVGLDTRINSSSLDGTSYTSNSPDIRTTLVQNSNIPIAAIDTSLNNLEAGSSPRDLLDNLTNILQKQYNYSYSDAVLAAGNTISGIVPKTPTLTGSLSEQVQTATQKAVGNTTVDTVALHNSLANSINSSLEELNLSPNDKASLVAQIQQHLKPTEDFVSYVEDILKSAGNIVLGSLGVINGTGYDNNDSVEQGIKKTTDIPI